VKEWFAVAVKLLLTRSVYCLVYRQKKESCNVGVSIVYYISKVERSTDVIS